MENDEQNKQTCQCVLTMQGDDPCSNPPDPATGEALLCRGCWTDPSHKRANMIPKRLPKRDLTTI